MARESLYLFRLKVMSLVTAGLFGILWVRTGYLQIARGDQYRQKSTELKVLRSLIPAVRGNIFDSKGRKVALEVPSFDLLVVPKKLFPTEHEEQAALSAELRRTKDELEKILNVLRDLIEDAGDIRPDKCLATLLKRRPELDAPENELLEIVGIFANVLKNHTETSDTVIIDEFVKARLKHRRAEQISELIAVLGMAPSKFFEKVDEFNAGIKKSISRQFARELDGVKKIDDPENREKRLKSLERQLRERHFSGRPQLFIKGLPKDIAMRVIAHSMDLDGIGISPSSTRHYPYGKIGCHIIGYVAPPKPDGSDFMPILRDASDEIVQSFLARETTLQSASTFKAVVNELYRRGRRIEDLVGRTGIEAAMEMELSLKRGLRVTTVNISDNTRRSFIERGPSNGENVILTVDWQFQEQVEKILAKAATSPALPPLTAKGPDGRTLKRGAAAVALHVATGEVLALASYPGYDINLLVPPAGRETSAEIFENPAKPAINRAVGGLYALGSCFKVVTACAMHNLGVPDAEMIYDCDGRYCELNIVHGHTDLAHAIKVSCNGFFRHLSDMRPGGAKGIYYMGLEFGFHQRTGIELPEERPGRIPTKEWFEEYFKRNKWKWQKGNTANLAIGQGDLLTTPLQAAVMIATVANNGVRMRPHLVKLPGKTAGDYFERRVEVAPSFMAEIQRGLRAVVNEPGGTGYHRDADEQRAYSYRHLPSGERLTIAGKSGSAQIQMRGMKQNSHAWFIAYAPYEKPEIAVAVIVEYAGGGGRIAAPAAREIIEAYLCGPEDPSAATVTAPEPSTDYGDDE